MSEVPLRDCRIGYISEASPETRALWEGVEANRRAFMQEVGEAERELLFSLSEVGADDLSGLSPAAAAHVRFCHAVSRPPVRVRFVLIEEDKR